jgi:hypothetical protein
MDRYGMHLSFAVFVHLRLVSFFKGNEVVVLFDSLIFLNGKLGDIDLRVNVDLYLVSFEFFG